MLSNVGSEHVQYASKVVTRAIGCLQGLAIADSIGHTWEFMAVRNCPHDAILTIECIDKKYSFKGDTDYTKNEFQLKPGQWTDDTSMALCMADSLLSCNAFDGRSQRTWYCNWWYAGLNNTFRRHHKRSQRTSVGLGGNIANSLNDAMGFSNNENNMSEYFTSDVNDSGNGSLMRLAPIALFYHDDPDINNVITHAKRSSRVTHPGDDAAEACGFLSFLIVRALHRTTNQSIAEFLDAQAADYIKMYLHEDQGITPSQSRLKRLLESKEPQTGPELCWNWKWDDLDVTGSLDTRRTHATERYNGHPISDGYFGAYSLDGLALALHAARSTGSFDDAISKVCYYRGDSDSTGAICGQIVGAFYDTTTINREWKESLYKWDNMEIAMRAVLLVGQ